VERRQRLFAVRLAPATQVLERLIRAVAAERLAGGPRQAGCERERHAEGPPRVEALSGTRLATRSGALAHATRTQPATSGLPRSLSRRARPASPPLVEVEPLIVTGEQQSAGAEQLPANLGKGRAAPARRLARERRPDAQHHPDRRDLDQLQLGEVGLKRVRAHPLADVVAKLDRVGLESHLQRRDEATLAKTLGPRNTRTRTRAGRGSVRVPATLRSLSLCGAEQAPIHGKTGLDRGLFHVRRAPDPHGAETGRRSGLHR
jgi:hypothetical protein